MIEEEYDTFQGPDVAYATRGHDAYIQQIRLDQSEETCTLVTSLFNGSGYGEPEGDTAGKLIVSRWTYQFFANRLGGNIAPFRRKSANC